MHAVLGGTSATSHRRWLADRGGFGRAGVATIVPRLVVVGIRGEHGVGLWLVLELYVFEFVRLLFFSFWKSGSKRCLFLYTHADLQQAWFEAQEPVL